MDVVYYALTVAVAVICWRLGYLQARRDGARRDAVLTDAAGRFHQGNGAQKLSPRPSEQLWD